MTHSRVAVTPGDGVLVRRASAVLFDATGQNPALVALFDDAATDADAIRALKQAIVDGDFGAAPVVALRWKPTLELIVFGELEVRTSAPTAPMLNAGQSTSWIEHHLDADALRALGEVSVSCGLPADPVTDLRLGIAGCGGIKVTLTADLTEAVSEPPAAPTPEPTVAEARTTQTQPAESPTHPVTAEQPPAEPVSSFPVTAEQPSAEAAVDSVEDIEDFSDTAELGVGPLSAVDEVRDLSAPVGEPDLMLPASQIADPFAAEILAVAHEPGTVHSDAPAAPPADPFAPANAEVPPEPHAVDAYRAGSHDAAPPGLIESALCERGHANPPRSAACFTCGGSINADPDWSLIDQPAVGQLVFPEGTVVPVDREIVLGRTPDVAARNALPVSIQHGEVSRSHAQIVVDGWAVLITDLDSRNGTWVCPPGSTTPTQLDPGVPHFLEDGTTVHLGGPEASFSYKL